MPMPRLISVVPVAVITLVSQWTACLVFAGAQPSSTAGAYSNVEYGVRTVSDPPQAWRTGRSTLMPWLYLLEDFTYEWGRERGRYELRGNQLLLSGSYRAWGPGRIDQDRRIIFNFRRASETGILQEFLVVMGYRGSLRDYPSRRLRGSVPRSATARNARSLRHLPQGGNV